MLKRYCCVQHCTTTTTAITIELQIDIFHKLKLIPLTMDAPVLCGCALRPPISTDPEQFSMEDGQYHMGRENMAEEQFGPTKPIVEHTTALALHMFSHYSVSAHVQFF